jgi:hypothetical protein
MGVSWRRSPSAPGPVHKVRERNDLRCRPGGCEPADLQQGREIDLWVGRTARCRRRPTFWQWQVEFPGGLRPSRCPFGPLPALTVRLDEAYGYNWRVLRRVWFSKWRWWRCGEPGHPSEWRLCRSAWHWHGQWPGFRRSLPSGVAGMAVGQGAGEARAAARHPGRVSRAAALAQGPAVSHVAEAASRVAGAASHVAEAATLPAGAASRVAEAASRAAGAASRVAGAASRVAGAASRVAGAVSRVAGAVSRVVGAVSRVAEAATLPAAFHTVAALAHARPQYDHHPSPPYHGGGRPPVLLQKDVEHCVCARV